MNNMRRGFTMIELVFVIVIIGILAAVALPRFTGISDDAHVSKLQAFTGTLNRTVGPSLWSGIQRSDQAASGSVNTTTYNNSQYGTLNTQVSDATNAELQSIPSEFKAESAAGLITLTGKCDDANTTAPEVGAATPTTGIIATSVTIGTGTYDLGCIDSSLNGSPRFWLGKTGGTVLTN